MIRIPALIGSFEFVVLAKLRTAQLARGCLPRVEGDHARIVIAQREIAEGKIGPVDGTLDTAASISGELAVVPRV